MTRRILFGVLMAAAMGLGQIQGWQAPAAPALTIGGDVASALTLSVADLKAMPRTRVQIDQNGRLVTFEGVRVADILTRAGAPMGSALHGPALMTYVVASGTDGYQALFSLAELDAEITKNDIIVADSADGGPLAAGQGTFRLVTPKDTRASRGVRLLERLEVVRLKK